VRVLDLDLDFFQSGIVIGNQGDERPRAEDHPPWTPEEVAAFLETRCGLTAACRLNGHRVETHDGVFDRWRELISAGDLEWPFDVVHVDAHADLSMGNGGWHYVCTELLHLEPHERWEPRRTPPSGLSEANYLLFAVASRWVRALTYVFHPDLSTHDGLPPDLLSVLFRDHDLHSGHLELPCFSIGEGCVDLSERGGATPVRREPPVPFEAISGDAFLCRDSFDFAFLSMSPRYASPAADDGPSEDRCACTRIRLRGIARQRSGAH